MLHHNHPAKKSICSYLIVFCMLLLYACKSKSHPAVSDYKQTNNATYFKITGIKEDKRIATAEAGNTSILYLLDAKNIPDLMLIFFKDSAGVQHTALIEFRENMKEQNSSTRYIDKTFLTDLHDKQNILTAWKNTFAKTSTADFSMNNTIVLDKKNIEIPLVEIDKNGGISFRQRNCQGNEFAGRDWAITKCSRKLCELANCIDRCATSRGADCNCFEIANEVKDICIPVLSSM
jgi:hypothetical protein